jgi:hypothetical protein
VFVLPAAQRRNLLFRSWMNPKSWLEMSFPRYYLGMPVRRVASMDTFVVYQPLPEDKILPQPEDAMPT